MAIDYVDEIPRTERDDIDDALKYAHKNKKKAVIPLSEYRFNLVRSRLDCYARDNNTSRRSKKQGDNLYVWFED